MTWPGTITVGVDREGGSRDAAQLAVRLATSCGATLKLVHVIEQAHRWSHHPVDLPQDQAERLGSATVDQSVGGIPQGTIVRICQGHPVTEIAKEATELLVLGRHTKGLLDAFVGGTAQRILHYATCPVLIHRTASTSLPRHLLLGIDGSEPSRRALEVAHRWATIFGGAVTVVHAFDPPGFSYDPDREGTPHYAVDVIRQEDFDEARNIVDSFAWGDVAHDLALDEGSPPDVIRDTAARVQADLIVLGTHGRGGLSRVLMGSVATRVVGSSTQSLLIVPAASS